MNEVESRCWRSSSSNSSSWVSSNERSNSDGMDRFRPCRDRRCTTTTSNKTKQTNKMSRKARRGEGKEKSQAQEAARRKQLNTRVMTMNKYETGAVGKCKGKRKEEEVEWQTNTVNTGGGVNAPLVAVRAHHHHRQNVRPSLSQR